MGATFGPVHTSVYRIFIGNIKFKGEACMNYTTNYHLPQWDETDRIMRTDFNQMCADMEAGLNANASAAEKAAELPYVVGSYTGNNALLRDFNLGFRPRFVLICGTGQRSAGQVNSVGIVAVGPISDFGRIHLTDTGFQLDSNDNGFPNPKVNSAAYDYDYIAFR